jgi:hypothetical protein
MVYTLFELYMNVIIALNVAEISQYISLLCFLNNI